MRKKSCGEQPHKSVLPGFRANPLQYNYVQFLAAKEGCRKQNLWRAFCRRRGAFAAQPPWCGATPPAGAPKFTASHNMLPFFFAVWRRSIVLRGVAWHPLSVWRPGNSSKLGRLCRSSQLVGYADKRKHMQVERVQAGISWGSCTWSKVCLHQPQGSGSA